MACAFKKLILIMALSALVACAAPNDTYKTANGTDINVANASKLDFATAIKSIEGSSRVDAINALNKFCKADKLNIKTVHSKLKSAGYLEVGSTSKDNTVVWVNPKGGAAIGTANRNANVMCMSMMAPKEAKVDQIDKLIKSSISKDLKKLPVFVPGAEAIWTSPKNRKNVYMLIKDKEKAAIAYVTM